jgi:apolipoprotein N-acyltransferase
VALIQEDFNTHFEPDAERDQRMFRQYWQRTLEAGQRHGELDLIVWPESVFTANLPEVVVRGEAATLAGAAAERLEAHQSLFRAKLRRVAEGVNRGGQNGNLEPRKIYLIIGTETVQLAEDRQEHFNTALLLDPGGVIAGRYYKMHPVMFGEYIPLGNLFPAIYDWTPMPQGLTPGPGPANFQVGAARLAPSICFESTVPHLIRRQVRELTQRGLRPDALLNITHDGWFWGSSMLDLQLACAVFRAVELRRAMLVAANAGISGAIDAWGRIEARGPRQGGATLVARIEHGGWESWYLLWGDLPAGLCLLAAVCLLLPRPGAVRRLAGPQVGHTR